MSITLRVQADNQEYPDRLLVEPIVADKQVNQLLDGEYDGQIAAFCEVLTIIREAVQKGDERTRIIESIDLYMELAYLRSLAYSHSFEHFLKHISGETKPGETISLDPGSLLAAAANANQGKGGE